MPTVFKPILPAKFKVNGFVEELAIASRDVEKGMLKDYQAGVKTWNHKPDFTSKTVINMNGGISIEVSTEDEVYTYVHEGTGPHDIRPRRARRLRFQNTYTAKTIPGLIQSRSGGASGDVVYSRGVRHPGFPGRFFSKPIKAKWGPFFSRQIQRAFDKAVKKSGQSI